MAVRVYMNAHSTEADEYDHGVSVTVTDEHLYVGDRDGAILAIYSPRSWHRAKVEDR